MATKLQGWRKLAGSSWGPPRDPQFMGDVEIDATELLAFVALLRERTGAHVTVTHLVGRAVAHGITRVPAMGVRLARGREHPRESIDVFFIVSTGGGTDLSGIKVTHADRKSAAEVADEVARSAKAIDDGTDADFHRAKQLLTLLPPRALRVALSLSAWLTSDLNLDLPALGMRRQAFGGAMVTSVGMWGITHAYSPLASYYKVPVLVLIGAVKARPIAVDERVEIRPMLALTATFDHRYVDGFQAAAFAGAVEEYLRNPQQFEPVGE
jgi:pyruvate/2-oxoglutarate dehydrogenase complex dihydrolipoamide acyltransferase (E2) component